MKGISKRKINSNINSRFFLGILLVLNLIGCKSSSSSTEILQPENKSYCTDSFCSGTYFGPEFVNGSDIAHQHSNTLAKIVGDQLKVLYKKGMYSYVKLDSIEMKTEGMGSGMVRYSLTIPFGKAASKCEAFTSFDHVGGWNHEPALERRKAEINGLLMKGDSLNVSKLHKTKEGLEEYWIQWRNKEVQKECEG